MAFRQYTKCYQHSPGDKPFNKSDLLGFVAGSTGPSIILSIIALALNPAAGGFMFGVTYATTILLVANAWLYHRLVCLGDDTPKCAIGVIQSEPEIAGLGEFDNDQFFDLRLMPHRVEDAYVDDDEDVGHVSDLSAPPRPTGDDGTTKHPGNDIYRDGFQGTALVRPTIGDLTYLMRRAVLHCEAEGSFWQAMKDTAILQGVAAGVGAGLGALGGAALGCAIGGIFGPIGCLIGAIIGAILGGILGGAAGAYIGAVIAFHSDPGDVNDANVGDTPLGPLRNGDKVAVVGRHVYDGFHQGWHELHPLMGIMRVPEREAGLYLEWDPGFADPAKLPGDAGVPDSYEGQPITKLTVDDMQRGLDSPKFRARAKWIRDRWCKLLDDAFAGTTRTAQGLERERWTIHPAVDGCVDVDLQVRIVRPPDGQSYQANGPNAVALQGIIEGGDDPATLTWTVKAASTGTATVVGTGATATWTFPAGKIDTYEITLNAVDAGGRTAATSIRVSTYSIR